MDAVRAAFRPEFLNRLDEILIFRRLSRQDMTGIVDIQLARLQQLLGERKISLEIDDEAKRWLAEEGYSPVYGARPLKRVIQHELQNPLAERILSGPKARPLGLPRPRSRSSFSPYRILNLPGRIAQRRNNGPP